MYVICACTWQQLSALGSCGFFCVGSPLQDWHLATSLCYWYWEPMLWWAFPSVVKRAKRLVGLIYCHFSSLSSSKTLPSLCTSYHRLFYSQVWVRHLHGTAIWDPSSAFLSSSVESVQYILWPQWFKNPGCPLCRSPLFPQVTYPAVPSSLIKTSHFLKNNNGLIPSLQLCILFLCLHYIVLMILLFLFVAHLSTSTNFLPLYIKTLELPLKAPDLSLIFSSI